ncbi:hypothetical protein [Kitasatospora sp. NPDC088134]|uniref:hypothetical protein n=1 Tax=Kitasatospora sp. NPDC088134 TaxID=3364071 RepID=UPI003802C2E2
MSSITIDTYATTAVLAKPVRPAKPVELVKPLEPVAPVEPVQPVAPVAEELPSAADMRLPVWFFGFEGVLAGAFDLLRAVPDAWPALVALGAVNLAVSLTMMRSRLKLAKLMWRGKGTRNTALALVGLRIGSHFLLGLLGAAVTGVLGHLLFGLLMAAVTVGLLAYAQRTALAALIAAGKITDGKVTA